MQFFSFGSALLATGFLFGCGNSGGSGAPDAGSLADADRSMMIGVHLGTTQAGSIVFSSKSDGTFLASTQADENGDAYLPDGAVGMISFVDSRSPSFVESIIGTNLGMDIHWSRPAAPIFSDTQTLKIELPAHKSADGYIVAICGDSDNFLDQPASDSLRLNDNCRDAEKIGVMAFADTDTGPVAYTYKELSLSAVAFERTISLTTWKTDFESVAVDAYLPPDTTDVRIGGVFDYDLLRVNVPKAKRPLDDLQITRPPGKVNHLWTEIVLSSGDSNRWQSHKGPLPTSDSDWITGAVDLTLEHSVDQAPRCHWTPSKEGDVIEGSYFWFAGPVLGSWSFSAGPEVAEAVFPDFPPEIAGLLVIEVDPDFGSFSIETYDYADVEDFQSGLSDDSLARSKEVYLEQGGSIRSAGSAEE